ncbi:MAG: hypothetical protein HC895_20725 [Leptolyngbyaceae cyanobacterium SM1_3_5]|nr:hypothetical protein [Leptolyngbyaceae cyanobacterium SM1_3_5]
MSNSLRPGNSLRKALSVRFADETALRDRIGATNRNDFFTFASMPQFVSRTADQRAE